MLSGTEILIIVFVVALVFGAGRLPQIGDALGRSIRNFKKAIKDDKEIDVTPPKPQIRSGKDEE
ncbi:twin-arginine translocase TatA/TatE family subunit [Myxococcota bacterium]|nr:twin-arginine translocase TatA/TatE family subunit [Myxococcota bacterium]